MSNITLTDIQALALAKQYREASSALRKYRIANDDKLTQPMKDRLKLVEASLRDAATDMTTAAVDIIIDDSKTSLADLGAVTADATAVLENIKGIKRVLSVATALLGLAAAIPTGNPKEVYDAFQALRALLPVKLAQKQTA